MIKIGITGQSGFIGTHLFNTLGLFRNEYTRIPFEDSYFSNQDMLSAFVRNCDAIVHLAAVNRHMDSDVIYHTNIGLVKDLIAVCEETKSAPHILFASSTQEENDNIYGRSKKEGRELLEKWANRNRARFTSFVIPNVFGPFGNPFYNSVVATFCHQLTHNKTPQIEIDAEVKLIYVAELIQKIIGCISDFKNAESGIEKIFIEHTAIIKVSELLNRLTVLKTDYLVSGIIPNLNEPFERNLFNTFLCYIDHDILSPLKLQLSRDDRGNFVEIIRFNTGGQVSFSTTMPGITRGNHFHTRKVERFVVIKGKAKVNLRRIGTNKVFSFILDGDQPSFVDIPIWYTHNITNIGETDLYTIFWVNEFYDSDDPDTFFDYV